MCFVYVIFDGSSPHSLLAHAWLVKYSAGAGLCLLLIPAAFVTGRHNMHWQLYVWTQCVCLKCIAMCVYSYFAPPHDSVILVLLYIEHYKGSLTDGWLTVNHPPRCTSNYHLHAGAHPNYEIKINI